MTIDYEELQADAEAPDREVSEDGVAKLVALGEEMAECRAELDTLEARRKEVQARYDQLRNKEIPDLMQSAGLVNAAGKGSFTLSAGSVYLKTDVYAAVNKAEEQAFFAALREKGHGGLIKETVHPQTLRAFAREQLQAGAELPPQVKTHEVTTAVLKRA